MLYEAICQGGDLDLPAPRPYRDYIEWLRTRDWLDAETFWREQLNGFTTPTPLVVARTAGEAQDPPAAHRVQQVTLSRRETGKLRSVAKENGLTVNTLLQGAWAVLLARYSGEEDVVFGVIRACRRSSVEGAESIVGLFVNTLPMRVRAQIPFVSNLTGQLGPGPAVQGNFLHPTAAGTQGSRQDRAGHHP